MRSKARAMASAQHGVKTMEDLFRSYWWLLFPLAWFIGGGFHSLMEYNRHRETLKIIKTYADKGEQPPEALMKALDAPVYVDDDDRRSARRARRYSRWEQGNWFSVVLFGTLALGFGYAAYTDMYGLGKAATIAGFILGALALAMLVQALMTPRIRQD